MSFSPDSKFFATNDAINSYIWDMQDFSLHFSVSGFTPEAPANEMLFTSDGKQFITSNRGQSITYLFEGEFQFYEHYTISIWDPLTGNLINEYAVEGRAMLINIHPTVNPDIIYVQDEMGAYYMNVKTGYESKSTSYDILQDKRTKFSYSGEFPGVEISFPDRYPKDRLLFYKTPDFELFFTYETNYLASNFRVSPDGRFITVLGYDGIVRVHGVRGD